MNFLPLPLLPTQEIMPTSYEDKIALLEKLSKTEQDLNKYVDKFGYI